MTSLIKQLASNSWLPWRIRHGIEQWTELWARDNLPFVYRFLHFYRFNNIVTKVTSGPNHHFFGYYDKSPWSKNGKFLACHSASIMDRPPTENDHAEIGIIDLDKNNKWVMLEKTKAWNWQQGAMLCWNPANPDKELVYNNRSDDAFISVLLNIDTGVIRTYPRPVYTLTKDGNTALSLNFSRLQTNRPGYGYAGIPDPWAHDPYPADDGIYNMDMHTGNYSLILSLYDLVNFNHNESMDHTVHWVNHLQINTTNTRFIFLHRWKKGEEGFESRLLSANLDGTELRCLLDFNMVSHYDWLDSENIIVWARHPSHGDRYYMINDKSGDVFVIGNGILTTDGHCTFSPDCEWVLTDTYPDVHNMRTLLLFNREQEKRIDLERFYAPPLLSGEIRCDLHPRWNHEGNYICVDSAHENERQMYLINLNKLNLK